MVQATVYSYALVISSPLLLQDVLRGGEKAALLLLAKPVEFYWHDPQYFPHSQPFSGSKAMPKVFRFHIPFSKASCTFVQPPADRLVWQALVFHLKSFHSLD